MVNAKRNRAPYRHLLLYGPPGTGKTMVAKRLVSVHPDRCCMLVAHAFHFGGQMRTRLVPRDD